MAPPARRLPQRWRLRLPRATATAVPLLVVAALCRPGAPQLVDLSTLDVSPSAYSLAVLRYFYVKEKGAGELAQLILRGMHLVSEKPDRPLAAAFEHYGGVQVTLLPEADFRENLDTAAFCKDGRFAESKLPNAITFTARPHGDADKDPHDGSLGDARLPRTNEEVNLRYFDLMAGGVHLLVLSNCGNLTGFKVAGSVGIWNRWGFLPPMEQPAKGVFFNANIFYTVLAAGWLLVCLRWWRSLLGVQKGILVVALFALCECIGWWLFFDVKNRTGLFGEVPFFIAVLSSAWKYVAVFFSLRSDPCKGSVDHPGGGFCAQALMVAFCVGHFHCNLLYTIVLERNLSKVALVLGVLPEVVFGIVLFIGVFQILSSFVEKLEIEKDSSKVLLYERLKVLVVGAGAAELCCNALRTFAATGGSSPTMWRYYVWMTHAIPQASFAFWLLVAMCLSFPTQEVQGSHRECGYEYSIQGQGGASVIGLGAPSTIWDDTDCEEPEPGAEESAGSSNGAPRMLVSVE